MGTYEFSPQQGAMNPTDRPQGTLEELKALKMDESNWGSCSPRSTFNKGCPLYKDGCPIPKIRDGLRVGKKLKQGPALIGVGVILSKVDGGAAGGQVMPCYDWFYRQMRNRRENAKKSGEVIRILGVEGDDVEVRSRVTAPLHKTRAAGMEVNCPGCAKGDCMLRADAVEVVNLKDVRFPRPAERFGALNEANMMAAQMLDEIERETDLAQLKAHRAQEAEIEDAKLAKD